MAEDNDGVEISRYKVIAKMKLTAIQYFFKSNYVSSSVEQKHKLINLNNGHARRCPLLIVIFLFFLPSGIQGQPPLCPSKKWDGYARKWGLICYEDMYLQTGYTQDETQQFCSARHSDAKLAYIKSDNEFSFIRSIVARGHKQHRLWLGLQKNSFGVWKWLADGTKLSTKLSQHWSTKQTDAMDNMYCAVVAFDNTTMVFEKESCDASIRGFICKLVVSTSREMCEKGWHGVISASTLYNCYKKFSKKKTFFGASTTCNNKGGKLFMPTNTREIYMADMISRGSQRILVWMGLHIVNQVWTWKTNEPFTPCDDHKWAANEPDNNSQHECAVIAKGAIRNFKLSSNYLYGRYSWNCSKKLQYVCQRPGKLSCHKDSQVSGCMVAGYPCSKHPCTHRGVCNVHQAAQDGYLCSCSSCFSGTTCQQTENPCSTNPCGAQSVCIITSREDYKCQCHGGWTGEQCLTQTFQSQSQGVDNVSDSIEICTNFPCENGGTCIISDDQSTPTCDCPVGYEGTDCSTATTTACSNQPCLNGGTCWVNEWIPDDTEGYFCTCLQDYSGANCENSNLHCSGNAFSEQDDWCVSNCLPGQICACIEDTYDCQDTSTSMLSTTGTFITNTISMMTTAAIDLCPPPEEIPCVADGNLAWTRQCVHNADCGGLFCCDNLCAEGRKCVPPICFANDTIETDRWCALHCPWDDSCRCENDKYVCCTDDDDDDDGLGLLIGGECPDPKQVECPSSDDEDCTSISCDEDFICCESQCEDIYTCITPAGSTQEGSSITECNCPDPRNSICNDTEPDCLVQEDCTGSVCCKTGCLSKKCTTCRTRTKICDCPNRLNTVCDESEPSCNSENDCGEDSSCCRTGCDTAKCVSCKHLRTTSPCDCPNPAEFMCVENQFNCSSLDDCDEQRLCCMTECGTPTCIQCPDVAANVICDCPNPLNAICDETQSDCESLADCGADATCCRTGCEYTKCVPCKPIRTIPPCNCPKPSDLTCTDDQFYCSNINDCGDDCACCMTDCGAPTCIQCPSVICECPDPLNSVCDESQPNCTSQYDCVEDTYCCKTGCHTSKCIPCRPHRTTAPCECPRIQDMDCQYSAQNCTSLDDCYEDRTCCASECGNNRCYLCPTYTTALAIDNTGNTELAESVPVGEYGTSNVLCPHLMNVSCMDSENRVCTNDEDCNDSQVCCEAECATSNLCTNPRRCPEAAECDNAHPQCTDHTDCTGGTICCQTACSGSTRCVDAAEETATTATTTTTSTTTESSQPYTGYAPVAEGASYSQSEDMQVAEEIPCPPTKTVVCNSNDPSCTDDDDCEGNTPCCKTGCQSKKCTNAGASSGKKRSAIVACHCPDPGMATCDESAEDCQANNDCLHDSVCCETGCQNSKCVKCVSPAADLRYISLMYAKRYRETSHQHADENSLKLKARLEVASKQP